MVVFVGVDVFGITILSIDVNGGSWVVGHEFNRSPAFLGGEKEKKRRKGGIKRNLKIKQRN